MNQLSQDLPTKLPSQAEMAECDRLTIDGGVPGFELMNRAGTALAECIKSIAGANFKDKRFCIFCGSGNNGGDGVVIARQLEDAGAIVDLVVASSKRYSVEMEAQLKNRIERGRTYYLFGEGGSLSEADLSVKLSSADFIVDSLLGTGQKDAPRGTIGDLVKLIQSSARSPIISIDIPTGVNGDTGEVFEPAIKAAHTICVELIKRGLVQYPGRDNCGEIHVVPIGILTSIPIQFELVTRKTAPAVPARGAASHKGSYGHVFVAGGSQNYPGAPVMSGMAALRIGAALVTKAHLKNEVETAMPPELMLATTEGEGHFSLKSFSGISKQLEASTVLVIGPGLGSETETGEFVKRVLKEFKGPRVIDADGLNLIAPSICKGDFDMNLLRDTVLTPHPGEMARLLGTDTKEVQRDRYSAADRLAENTGAVVVLKGAATIISFGKSGWVNSTGNPFMATGGSGDVLAGIIAGLMAQKMTPLDAAKRGVFIHGLAGDNAAEKNGGAIIASDIVDSIPAAFAALHEG